jgi:hypothetical protein
MRRVTTVLALALATAAVPATASAAPPAWAGEKPGNYGSCVAWEAMFGDGPVSEFHRTRSPAVTLGFNGEKTLGPNTPDETSMACVIDFRKG